MIVSWNWLKQYVPLSMSAGELEERLMMAGLNHEGTEEVGGDLAIDLEVTSNRPDCLGHIGVAREVAVLWDCELTIPPARPAEGKTPVDDLVKVRIDCPDLCYRYTARVIRGVKIGPSPKWMVRRLATLGIIGRGVDRAELGLSTRLAGSEGLAEDPCRDRACFHSAGLRRTAETPAQVPVPVVRVADTGGPGGHGGCMVHPVGCYGAFERDLVHETG